MLRISLDEYPHVDLVCSGCAKLGRDPRSIQRSIGVDEGSINLADEIHAAGADEIHMGVDGPDFDFAPIKDWLAWRDDKNS